MSKATAYVTCGACGSCQPCGVLGEALAAARTMGAHIAELEAARDAERAGAAKLREALKDTAWELDCVLEALNEATPEDTYGTTKSDGMSALVVARALLATDAGKVTT